VQKLVQDSNVALETYQQQVCTLEEHIAHGDGRYVAQPPFPRFSGPGALIEREGWSSFRWRDSRSNSTRQSRPRHCAAIAQSHFYEEKCQKAVRRHQKLTTIKARHTAVNPRTGTCGRRDGTQTFWSGIPSAFSFQVEDESSFSLIDNKTGTPRHGSAFTRGRGTNHSTTNYGSRAPQRNTRGGFAANRGSGPQGGRKGWRDWEKVSMVHVTF